MLRMGFASNIPNVGSIKLTTCPKLGGPAETSTPSSAISGSAPGIICSPIWSNSSSLLSSLSLPCFRGLETEGLVAGPGFGWADWDPCLLRPFSSSIDSQFAKIWPNAPVSRKLLKVPAGDVRRAALRTPQLQEAPWHSSRSKERLATGAGIGREVVRTSTDERLLWPKPAR
jgi:hypothetical protein